MLPGTTRPTNVLTSTVVVFLTHFLLLHPILWPHKLQKNREEYPDDPELEDEGHPNGILL
jgi:hypothetical protein